MIPNDALIHIRRMRADYADKLHATSPRAVDHSRRTATYNDRKFFVDRIEALDVAVVAITEWDRAGARPDG